MKVKKRRNKEWLQNLSLQQKLTGVFGLTAIIILFVNLYVNSMINSMIGQVEAVYESNVGLNELSDELDRVQTSLGEYLDTKSSESMESYYRSEQKYRERMEMLHTEIMDDDMVLKEKHIVRLSESYLVLTDETIQAKRGRNVEKYGQLYEEATVLYHNIHTFITSLNNEQFKNNSQTYQILTASLRYMEHITVIVLVLVLLGNIAFILLSMKMVTEPLWNLAQKADEVAKGNFEVGELEVHSQDEIGIVTSAFNQMIKSIRNYIEQLRTTMERQMQMQGHLKDAQLKYLQAQINPHFLFNTLNAGAQLAMMEGADRTEEFLQHTAAFFRYNVRKNNQDALLSEEIALVDSYIYILNVRFAGEICFEKDIDENLLDVRVPGMILQPLVENAVKYGIRGLDRKGMIELSVYEKNGRVYISIWDNGSGMDADKIEQVLSGKLQQVNSEQKSNSNGVGMYNVLERLRLYFYEKATLEIFSEGKDRGTEVLICIPGKVQTDVSNNVGR